MHQTPHRRFTLAFLLSFIFLAASSTVAAQYYPPPPPPPPPYPYPPPPPPPPQYPRDAQYPRRPVYPTYRRDSAYFSPYAMFSAGHYSGIGVGNGTAPTQSGGMTALGGTFGAYVLYPGPGPVRAGIDGSGARLPVVPYFQFEIGGVGTNNGTSTNRTGSFAYQAQFGADFPLATPQVAARIEYGTGQLTNIGNTNHTLQTFSAGIVFHIR